MAKEAAPAQDQSMEEILQSIKRIIAEENVEAAEEQSAPKEAPKKMESVRAASDVLELTDIAEEDEDEFAQSGMDEVQAMMSAPPKQVMSSSASNTRMESILEAVDREPAGAVHNDVLMDIDSLLSSEAAKASAKALKSIPSAPAPASAPRAVSQSMGFRSGTTVEDLAMEALRPMLKDWLDANLPAIVERLVEREIKKLSAM